MCSLPVRRDAQVFVEKPAQEYRVVLVFSTIDLANTVERAECTRVSLSSERHHLVRVDMHCNVLEDTDTKLMWANCGWIIRD